MADNEWYILPGTPQTGTYNVYQIVRSNDNWYAVFGKYDYNPGTDTHWMYPYFAEITDLQTLACTELGGPYVDGGGDNLYPAGYSWYLGRQMAVDKNEVIWFALYEYAFPNGILHIYSFDPTTDLTPQLRRSESVSILTYYSNTLEDIVASSDGEYVYFVSSELFIRYTVATDSFAVVEPYGWTASDRTDIDAYCDQAAICEHNGDLYLSLLTYDSVAKTKCRLMKSTDNGDTWTLLLTWSYQAWAPGVGVLHQLISCNGYIYGIGAPLSVPKIFKWDGTSTPPTKIATSSLASGSLDYMSLTPALADPLGTKLWVGGGEENVTYYGTIRELDTEAPSGSNISLLFTWECPDCAGDGAPEYFSNAYWDFVDGEYPDGRRVWIASNMNYSFGVGVGDPGWYTSTAFQFDFVSASGTPPAPSGEPIPGEEPETPPLSGDEYPQEYEKQILQQGRGYGRAYEMKVTDGNIIIVYGE